MPRLRGRQLEAAEQVVGQKHTRQFQETEDDEKPKLTPVIVQPVDKPVDKKWADMMAFNEEIIEIVVHETSDKNEAVIPDVYCNGIPQRFIRGQTQAVKRKFVEILARAKKTTYGNQKITTDGEDSYVYPSQTALRYPFMVVKDSNPRGIDWLKSVLAQG